MAWDKAKTASIMTLLIILYALPILFVLIIIPLLFSGCAAWEYVNRSYIPNIGAETDWDIQDAQKSYLTCRAKALLTADILCKDYPTSEVYIAFYSTMGVKGARRHCNVIWKRNAWDEPYLIDPSDFSWELNAGYFGTEVYRQRWSYGARIDCEALEKAYREFWGN